MPRRRKKSSRISRKPPLMFSESPLEMSLRFASPAAGAVNPVTAEIVSLQDQHHTTWVSPQFDPTAPPSERRRRGRRNRKENARTACSQNPNSRKDILADIDNIEDENKVCDRRKLDYINSDESLTDIEDQSPEEISSNNVESNKENCNSDMSLCSLVASCSLLHEKGSFKRTPVALCNGGQHESSHANDEKRYCPTCSGSCLALAGDTPVQEYNLRVSERNRRGRLPKTAWEKLMAGT